MRLKGFILCCVIILFSCGKDRDLSSLLIRPEAALLLFPENLTQCYEGTVVSDTQSDVTFQWNPVGNANMYELHISNLLTGSTDIYVTENSDFMARIERGVPYSWFVVSMVEGSSATAPSEVWSFYNAGDAITSYVPFPAEALNPLPGANLSNVTSITLIWEAEDLDDDISSYDVFFGTVSPPSIFQSELESPSLPDVPISGNQTYYWQILARDYNGNESLSRIFNFNVN